MSMSGDPLSNPAGGSLVPSSEPDDLSGHAHRQLIGYLGLSLPVLVWLAAGWRPMSGLEAWTLLGSISAYYHTGAVAALVGILIALAVFFFTYRGYGNEYGRRDRIAAVMAGAAAVLVAVFPARPPDGLPPPLWWDETTGRIHYAAAVVLFGAFIFFALFQFPKSKQTPGEPLPLDKRVRNRIYRVCGAAMAVCVAWAGTALFTGAAIFWPEALALECFAVSWLVKGRADRTAIAVGTRTLGARGRWR